MKKIVKASLSKDIEIPILVFLWRWKVATTSAIHFRFKPDLKWKTITTYARMLNLEKKGFVSYKYSDNCQFKVWTLTAHGYRAISNKLNLLREEGYLSENIEHDVYVMAAQNGEWLPRHSALDVGNTTEQELRRFSLEALPQDIPDVCEHRPDGYWMFNESSPKNIIALEVEINRKSTEDYIEIGEFYNTFKNITSVLWIIQSQALANKIRDAASIKLTVYRNIHNFILLSDFIENGWDSNIFLGNYSSNKMYEFLNKHRFKNDVKISYKTHKSFYVQKILDSRVMHYESSAYKDPKKPELGN